MFHWVVQRLQFYRPSTMPGIIMSLVNNHNFFGILGILILKILILMSRFFDNTLPDFDSGYLSIHPPTGS